MDWDVHCFDRPLGHCKDWFENKKRGLPREKTAEPKRPVQVQAVEQLVGQLRALELQPPQRRAELRPPDLPRPVHVQRREGRGDAGEVVPDGARGARRGIPSLEMACEKAPLFGETRCYRKTLPKGGENAFQELEVCRFGGRPFFFRLVV